MYMKIDIRFIRKIMVAFDTIDHDNLLCFLEKFVGICGNTLKTN